MSVKTDTHYRPPAPLDVFWMLTNRCNLECNFCMVESGPRPDVLTEELNMEDQFRLARLIIKGGAMRVTFTGGEPTIFTHVPELVAQFTEAGIYTYLTTNAILIDADYADGLATAGLHEAQISLNGSHADINDPIMGGSHAFSRILKGLRNLKKVGLKTRAKITITRENRHDIPALLHLLKDEGVDRIQAAEVGPRGRAASKLWQLQPDIQALEQLEHAILHEFAGLQIDFSSYSLDRARMAAGLPSQCSLGEPGQPVVTLLPNSDMIACNAMWHVGIANPVLEHGLTGAWRRLPELYARFRQDDFLADACIRCDYRDACGGGCRGLAHRAFGTWQAVDPDCPHLRRYKGVDIFHHEGKSIIPIRPTTKEAA